jgi:hypothetical protein
MGRASLLLLPLLQRKSWYGENPQQQQQQGLGAAVVPLQALAEEVKAPASSSSSSSSSSSCRRHLPVEASGQQCSRSGSSSKSKLLELQAWV